MTTLNTPLQKQAVADASTSWSQTLNFAQFDPSLGTLTGVAFGLTGGINGSILLDNLDRAPASFDVGFSGRVSLLAPGGSQVASAPVAAHASTTLAAGGMTMLGGITGSASDQKTYVPSTTPAGIAEAPFVGTGTVPLTVNAQQSMLHLAGPGNLAVVSQAAAGASVSLRYGYAPADAGAGFGFRSVGVQLVSVGAGIGVGEFASATALTTAPQTFTFADRTTGWNDRAAVSQFDPALGALQSVNITVSTGLLGSIAAENLGNASWSLITQDTVTLTVDLPGSTPTVATTASTSDGMSLGALDGDVDYAGTSGHIDQLSAQSDPLSMWGGFGTQLHSASDLTAFTGNGTVVLPVSATSNATIDGPGNLVAGLLTEAGGTVSVSYTYIPASPAAPEAITSTSGAAGYTVTNLTTNRPDTATTVHPYAGGADGPTQELLDTSGDNLAINLTSDNWLIGTDGGSDVIMTHGGNNIFNIAGGSNWLIGAGGDDTFSLRAGGSNAWDTIVNFHAGDWLVVWGISQQDSVSWLNGGGASGYTGLTMAANAPDGTGSAVTLARYYGTADFGNGRLTTGFGTDAASGTNYLYVHANT